MSTIEWQRVQELFERALELGPDERGAYLDGVCGGDPALRAELDSLLAHHGQAATGFLAGPAAPGGESGAALVDPLLGTRIGRYQIDAVIAAGGMGTVYRATQDAPRRTVALKLLRPGWYSPSAIRRFDYESQLLAALRHPHIAQVYEAGTADHLGGIPYFAMEYVPDAAAITDYAEARALSTRERLALVTQVCDAVAHGHQKGIIHRDLKPANILVDDGGQVKIIDFGVARATDADVTASLRTDVGQLVGTLQYMSPEQCDADPHGIDARSDVYSLGIVLYELLTGQLPYEVSGTLYAAARTIRDEPARRLSLINRRLRGDVEAIALRALEKNRERRYQSAAELGADIGRYLRREPVSARPPTLLADVIRWSLRHPKTATTSVCLALAVLIVSTAAALAWYANTKPWRVEIVDDGRELRLLSFAGGILDSIPSDHDWGIRFAELVERPSEFGGGRVIIAGFGNIDDLELRGRLCLFDADRGFDDPIWIRQIQTEEIPPSARAKREYHGEQAMITEYYLLADIFPGTEFPGNEIVTSHNLRPYSPSSLHVHDFAGNLLYEAWHEGSLSALVWLEKPGLVVVRGCESAAEWPTFGCLHITNVHPIKLVALRPRPHIRTRDFINADPDLIAQHIVWERFIAPPEVSNFEYGGAVSHLGPPGPLHDARSNFQIELSLLPVPDMPSMLCWVIDEHGNEIPGSRMIGDALRHPRSTIDPSRFRLVTREELPGLCAEQAD